MGRIAETETHQASQTWKPWQRLTPTSSPTALGKPCSCKTVVTRNSMSAKQSEFTIATADVLQIADHEISGLLMQVYVAGGFTTPEEAVSLFEPPAVRKRGTLIGARDNRNSKLAGFVILVPPDSPARRLAADNEGELHLLGVLPEYRGQGLGRLLIKASIDKASRSSYSKLILWTQLAMRSAQRLYETSGFQHVNDFERNGRKFKVYERKLQPTSDREA